MAFELRIWFGHSDKGCPALVEEVVSLAAGNSRAQEVISDGYITTDAAGAHHFYPGSSVNHVRINEKIEPEEE